MKNLPLMALLFLSACAANPATGGRTFSLVSEREERALGESAADSLLKQYGLYRPESVTTKYVDDLCRRTFAVTEASTTPLQCNFLDDGSFNASATPGYMLVNRGLLPFMNSEAELVAVLGHESGHLTARHINQAATNARIASIALTALAVGVAAKSEDATTTNLAIGAGSIGAAIGLSAYSRAHETEADALGRRYMEKMGYDPRESVNMVRGMAMYDTYQRQQRAYFGESAPEGLFTRLQSSHPASPERVAAAVSATGEPTLVAPETDLSRKRFMDAIEGLTYGPARRWGIARKAELVLTQQRVAIPLPAAVTAAYTPGSSHDALGTWLVAHPQSGAYLTVTSVPLTQGRSPAALVEKLLPMSHEPVQAMQVGQAEKISTAYTATYKFFTGQKRYRVLAVPASHPVDQMLVITAIYPNETVMQQEDGNLFAILKNLRFLTENQADKYQQLQLHSFTAAGEDVAYRAEKLPVGALQEQLFRAMNNLPDGKQMVVGQRYKTIIDPNP